MSGYQELLESGNLAIADMAMKCEQVLSSHERALVSISGGADSDVMMDLCERVREHVGCDVDYVWFNTGMEYDATKRHLEYLEERYGTDIRRERSVKTIPVCAREKGQPFVSKMTSQHMGILQRHDFQWEDKPLAILRLDYPDCPISSLKWWTDAYARSHGGGYTSYCISRNKWLKEFVTENPPEFRISADCCKYAKKETKRELLKTGEWDVELVGIRQAEGGVRSLHGRCFIAGGAYRGVDAYYPLFWLTDAAKQKYVRRFGIRHSDCYETWGFTRTGCVGCPFNRNVFSDIETVDAFEPNMAKAARTVFEDAYEYTRRYREFKRDMEQNGQLRIF